MPLKINISQGTQSKSATQLLGFLKDVGKTGKDLRIHLDGNAVVLFAKGEKIPKELMETERTLYSADGKGRNSFLSKDVMGKARIAVYNAIANEFSDDVANEVVTNKLQDIFFPPEGKEIKAAPGESLSDLAETLQNAIDAASELTGGKQHVAPSSIEDDKKEDIPDNNNDDYNINLKTKSDDIDDNIDDLNDNKEDIYQDVSVSNDDESKLKKSDSNYVTITLAPEEPSEPPDKSLADPKDSSLDPNDPFAGFLAKNDDKVTNDDADTNNADDKPPVQLPLDNNLLKELNDSTDEVNDQAEELNDLMDELNIPTIGLPIDDEIDDESLEDADLKLGELPELEGTPTKREVGPQGNSSDDKKTDPAQSKDGFAPKDYLHGVPFETRGLDIGEDDDD